MDSKKDIYIKLFKSTFYLSAFTFGGGYVIVPLMKKKFVEELNWIDEKEMLDMIAIAQSTPGAMAVNTSILVGFKIAGVPGALVCMLGTILPPLIILSIVSLFYESFSENIYIKNALKGMQAAVGAIIIDVVFNMGYSIVKNKNILYISLMIISFVLTFFFKINVMTIIFMCAVIGALNTFKKQK